MPDVSATEAARNFSHLLNGVEHRGEHYTIVRRGRAIARLEPIARGGGARVRTLLEQHSPDEAWWSELHELRGLLELEDRR